MGSNPIGSTNLVSHLRASHLRANHLRPIAFGCWAVLTAGALVAFAKHLGFADATAWLQQTLDEEKAADAKLTQIAETEINQNAEQARRAAARM